MKLSLWGRLRANHGLAFMWILVLLFTLSSVIVNGAHALDVTAGEPSSWMRGMAVVVASFFPFAGLVMTEAVLIMIRSWRVSHWWVTAMQALLIAASLVMLIVAFWRSFNALTEMAVMLSIPASDAWMLPVLTDTGIVVGTIGVVLAEVKMKIDGDAAALAEVAEAERRAAEAELEAAAQAVARAELEAQRATEVAPVVSVSEVVTDQGDRAADHVTDQAADHAVTSSALMVTDQADQSTDHGPLVVTDHADHVTDQAVTTVLHLVSDQTDHVTDHRPVPVSPQVNGHDQAADQGPAVVTDQETDHGDHPGTTAPAVVTDQSTDHGDYATDHAVTTAPEVVSDHADHVADQAAEHSSDHADHTVTTDPPDGWAAALGADAEGLSELGAMVRADLGTETSAEDITRALEMVQAGTSRRAVAEAVGVGSHNTIRRWVEAASRLDAGYAAAVG